MSQFAHFVALSPVPIVALDDITAPQGGVIIPTSEECIDHFKNGDTCKRHYRELSKSSSSPHASITCPYGFTSQIIPTDHLRLAFTGIVPQPRTGGRDRNFEQRCIKQRIRREALTRMVQSFGDMITRLAELESETVQKYSMALHEIRKLNRTIKQTAERMCVQQSPGNPHAANTDIVQIWKSSELMTSQFDVIEILANESLASLPTKTIIQVYRIFDKCVRIYNPFRGRQRLALSAPYEYSGNVYACDKTFSIIPSALLENALKYSIPDSVINVSIFSLSGRCVVTVTNRALRSVPLTGDVFNKGVRGTTDGEGSGHGLYLAQLVAKQHDGTLTVRTQPISNTEMECEFTLSLPEAY